MRPRSDQVKWLKNGKPKERVAIYLDVMYVLWDDGSVRPVTLQSLNQEQVKSLREFVQSNPAKVSIVESPKTREILAPIIEAETRKMQSILRMLTEDDLLEMSMEVCYVDVALFDSLLKRLRGKSVAGCNLGPDC